METETMEPLSTKIPDFFKGKCIFITGFTGFLGKVLVEKLLYSCPELDTIYILMRAKKNQTLDERLETIFKSVCFNRLKEKYPGSLESKVVPIEGDLTSPLLGLSDVDLEKLTERVDVVFHGAANIKFNDHVEAAINVNTRGTYNMLQLATRMKNLSSFVYISTAYSQSDKVIVDEEYYPAVNDWRETLSVCEKTDKRILSILSEKYLGNLRNTYVYSKNITESVIKDFEDTIPITIIRPSIVVNAYSEPLPGWNDSIFGPIASSLIISTGITRTFLMDLSIVSDYIYVDFVIKASIISAVKKATEEKNTSVAVYNCCAGKYGITNGSFVSYSTQDGIVKDLTQANLYYNNCRYTINKTLFYLDFFYRNMLTAFLVDTLLSLANQKPLLMKIRRKIYIHMMAVSHFLTTEFYFENKKFLQLSACVQPDDKEQFSYEIDDLDVPHSFLNAYNGSKHFTYKMVFERKDEFSNKLRMLHWMDIFVEGSVYLATAYMLYNFALKLIF